MLLKVVAKGDIGNGNIGYIAEYYSNGVKVAEYVSHQMESSIDGWTTDHSNQHLEFGSGSGSGNDKGMEYSSSFYYVHPVLNFYKDGFGGDANVVIDKIVIIPTV